jgi:hypothetical protein
MEAIFNFVAISLNEILFRDGKPTSKFSKRSFLQINRKKVFIAITY